MYSYHMSNTLGLRHEPGMIQAQKQFQNDINRFETTLPHERSERNLLNGGGLESIIHYDNPLERSVVTVPIKNPHPFKDSYNDYDDGYFEESTDESFFEDDSFEDVE